MFRTEKNIQTVKEKLITADKKIGALPVFQSGFFDNFTVFPGFADVHVHLREPGFIYKEDIYSGSRAAARGGYTDICAMPNLNPVPDSLENLREELASIDKKAVIGVHPYGSLTVGERGEKLSDMESISPFVAAFSDDGRGLSDGKIMEQAMIKAKALGKIIAAHCEDMSLVRGGYVNDCEYARKHGHAGNAPESEWKQVERDICLAAKTGAAYHVCHISTKESAELIRQAKKDGIDVTCETAPHYLLLDDSMLVDSGNFKMNPPLRAKKDREALLEGLCDGTVDMIATDHAPHSAEEKSGGLKGSLMGVVGLETAFPVLYTGLVKNGIITLEKLIECLSENPRRRFSLPVTENDFSVWDLNTEYEIDPENFLSKGKSTPFAGKRVFGKCLMTVYGGKIVWSENSTER